MKPLAPNTLIQNRYLLVHLIGKGGMGEVYLAVDQRLGSAVALKRTFFADDEMLGGAFEREARTLARLRHPVLPKVSDHFTENGEQYLVMEHIAGDDLAKRLEGAQKPFPLSWVLFWADQLLDALSYLHSHEPPIIHRDIKPQNLKLTDENHIVLLDFGLSKNTTDQPKNSGSGSTGSVVGYTPHYAPMEQIRGTGTNPRSDIYSLSATLYQLMSNVVPADALTRADALLNGSKDPITPLNELNPEVPSEVSEVILHGMEVSQEKRFGNAKDMQKALRKAFSQMQEAMSAQTIAFSAPAAIVSKIEQPVGVDHSVNAASRDEASSQATQVREEPAPQANVISAFSERTDAAASYNGPVDSLPRQSDIKTEVYNAGNGPLYVPAEPEYVVNDATPVPDATTDWSALDAGTKNGGYSPDATAANIDFGSAMPSTPYSSTDTVADSADVHNEAFPAGAAALDQQAQYESVPSRAVQVPAKKKSSKAIWAVGGLAVLFVFGIVAAGAGWFVYSNYYAAETVQPAPTPEPTLEALPTPEPTIESAAVDTNSNSSTAVAETNSNSNSNSALPMVLPTPQAESPAVVTRETNPGTKPPPQVEARKTPAKTTTGPPAVKTTPKKSERTVILQ